jgi:RNA polymerase sigma-70 factor (ECF subfamily)
MERHYQRIYRIALSYLRDTDEALDAVQETFVKAYRHAARWNAASDVGPWLTRIAVNHSIDSYRRGRRRNATFQPLVDGDHDQRLTAGEISPERRVLNAEMAGRLDAAIGGLPARQRAVFVLRHHQEMTLEEIARALDMRLGTVKSSLHRAIQGLRQRLEDARR